MNRRSIEGLRPAMSIHLHTGRIQTTDKDLRHSSDDPIRMRRTAGYVDHRGGDLRLLQDVWNRTSASDKPGWTLIMSSSFDEKRALGRVVITGFVKQGKLYRKFQEEHIERGYRAEEIDQLLDRAGFVFRKYDGRDFRRPRKRSPRLVYVCPRSK